MYVRIPIDTGYWKQIQDHNNTQLTFIISVLVTKVFPFIQSTVNLKFDIFTFYMCKYVHQPSDKVTFYTSYKVL